MTRPWWKFWAPQQKGLTDVQALLMRSTATWSARHFIAFATEGFRDNTTTRACVGAIQKASRECPVVLQAPDGTVIDKHPLLELLARPNPWQSYEEFLDELLAYRLISGEGDIWANAVGRKVSEMWVLRPDWLEPTYENGIPKVWTYTPADNTRTAMTVEPENLLIWKEFNPLDRWRGLSPLWSCAFAIDTLNQYARANKALLDNDVRPSGVLWTETNLSDTSYARLKAQFEETYGGADNNGRPMLLEGGLRWQQQGLSPREMEFIAGKRAGEQDVCKVLGVPGQMIGLDGSQTFANYEQARAAFYEDTVVPTVNSAMAAITRWLGPRYGLKPGMTLTVDVEGVAALEPRRAERNRTIDLMQSLTVNEKRASMGYQDVEDGDTLLIGSNLVPLSMAGADSLVPPNPIAAGAQAGLIPPAAEGEPGAAQIQPGEPA
jgi:HK97 family phage portal protein